MAKYSEYAEAFTIFAKYGDNAEGVYADYEEILAGPEPSEVSAEDLARLSELGWFDSEEECFRKFT